MLSVKENNGVENREHTVRKDWAWPVLSVREERIVGWGTESTQ